MAQNPGQLKRIKEAGRREKQRDKAERKEQRRKEAEDRRKNLPPGEDPDLVGIRPGPQPPLED